MALTSSTLNNEREAFVFLAECTLATISSLATRSRPPKGELNRQISMAQTAINWIRAIEREKDREWSGASRVEKILDNNLSVSDWANSLRQ